MMMKYFLKMDDMDENMKTIGMYLAWIAWIAWARMFVQGDGF